MSTPNVTPNPADVGMATGPAPIPAAPSAIQPNPAAQPTAQPNAQPGDNSNAPDAQTPAAKSIPQNLINNPAAPTQKMAAIADDNKNSSSPPHSQLYRAAIEMTGGQRYTTSLDAENNIVRTPISPKPWALGLALALNVLQGGLAGGGAKTVGEAAQAGAQVAQQQRARVQAANQQQDAQAKADQDHKLEVTKTNLQVHQLAMNVGKQDLEMNQAYVDSFVPVVKMLESRPGLIKGDISEDQMNDMLKSGKYNVTANNFIPHGQPFPIMDAATGKQKEVDGVKIWGHNYYVVDAAAKGTLTQEIQDQGYKIGKFRNPDGSRAVLPTNSEYPMRALGTDATQYARIQTAEEMLDRQKSDVLGDKAGPRESLADWAAQGPQNMQAVDDYSRFLGKGAPDQVFGAMLANGAGQSDQLLMQHMGVTSDDLRKKENQRLQEHTEAVTKEPQEKALTPEESAHIKAQTKQANAAADKDTAEAAKLRKEADAVSTGGKMPDGSWNVNSTPIALVEGNMDPTQMTKRAKDYNASIEAANAYSMEKYGKPFDMAKAQSDYTYAKNVQAQGVLKMIDGMVEPNGAIQIANNAAKKLPGLDERTANQVFNAGATEFGSTAATDFHTAMLGLADEYSKVMGGGVSSDTGRQQALDILHQGYSDKQLAHSIEIMRKDIAARKAALIGNNRYLMKWSGVSIPAGNTAATAPVSHLPGNPFAPKTGGQ